MKNAYAQYRSIASVSNFKKITFHDSVTFTIPASMFELNNSNYSENNFSGERNVQMKKYTKRENVSSVSNVVNRSLLLSKYNERGRAKDDSINFPSKTFQSRPT